MLASDFRFACRRLLRRPGFAALVTLTLALGIGAATTVFTVVDAVLLRPLPFAQPDRVVELGTVMEGGFTVPRVRTEVLDVLGSQPALLQRLARFGDHQVVLEDGEPRQLRAVDVSPDFFPVLGVRPQSGRVFAPEESAAGARVAVVSDELWRSALGEDPKVVGRTITLSGERYEVVGVMPANFRYPRGRVSLWLPMPDARATAATSAPATTSGTPRVTRVEAVGRLADGVALPQAQAMADQIGARLGESRPDVKEWKVALTAAGAWRANPDMRRALLILAGAVGCVLLIACGNAANLMLVRATTDRRNLTVRLALGATRARVIRELMVEAALLAAAGGALGILLAHGGVRVMRAIVPSELVSFSYSPLALDGRVLGFAVVMAVASVLLAGFGPAMQATARRAGLGGGDRTGTGTVAQKRLRSALVIGELALSMMLLVGAGLLTHSFARLSNVPPGMETEHLALLNLSPSAERYPDDASRAAFYNAVLRRIDVLPAVRSTSVVSGVAGGGGGIHFNLAIEAEGAAAPLSVQPAILPVGEADTSYFRTLGIPILAGRAFVTGDMVPGSDAAIVDVNLARALWSDGRAVGRRFRLDTDERWLTVVGVSGAVKLMGPDDRESPFGYYRPVPAGAAGYRTIAVRTTGDPALLVPALKAAVHAVDPLQPVSRASTGRETYREPLMKPRFLLAVMSAFALVAALLAAVGLYGVIAFAVAQRTRELGVRMALGARAGQIVAAVLGEGALLAVGGIVLGLIAAVAMSRVLGSLLFGVSPTDPPTLAAVAVGLAAVTLLACWIPARRASRVDPVVALRTE